MLPEFFFSRFALIKSYFNMTSDPAFWERVDFFDAVMKEIDNNNQNNNNNNSDKGNHSKVKNAEINVTSAKANNRSKKVDL